MAKSGKRGAKTGFKIAEAEPKLTAIDLERDKLSSKTEGVSVSLKYYRKETECFSEWQSSELKKFSDAIYKMKQLSSDQLKSYGSLCGRHSHSPAEARFTKPKELSEDLTFYEIRVDHSNAARIHGVIVGSVFYLVWLDRLHAVFPD